MKKQNAKRYYGSKFIRTGLSGHPCRFDELPSLMFEFKVWQKIPRFLLLVEISRNNFHVGTCIMTYADWKDWGCLEEVCTHICNGKYFTF
jgi:hypothetical protein